MNEKKSTKAINLGDKRFFELAIGERRVQRQLDKSTGTIPIYSGNITVPFGHVEKPSTIDDFAHDYIIWGIDDANFDFGFMAKGTMFDITDHCGAIKILDTTIIAEYLFYELQSMKKSLRFNWMRRPNLGEMSKVTVNIPIKTDDGSFDTDKQMAISKQFFGVRESKQELKQIKDTVEAVEFEVSNDEIGSHMLVSLGDRRFFTVDNGERIRKEDIEKAKGDIPVYSSSKFESDMLGKVSDNIKEIIPKASSFDGINLTVSADGSVGSVFVREGKFYANDVCNIVTVLHPKIDPHFVKYELRTQLYRMRLSWGNKLYKQRLRTVSIRIPVDEKKDPNLEKQRVLVKKYLQAAELKKQITQELDALITATVAL